MEDKRAIYSQQVESTERGTVVHETKVEALNVDLAKALQQNKPNPWSRGYIRLYLMCGLVYLCSTMNGFDGSLMGSINAMPSYIAYYNLPPEGNSSTGIVFAIFQVGQMVGALFTWISDWRGRRLPIFIGCLGTCVGAIITATAPNLSAFIGGRFILSFFSTIATMTAPMYLIEIAPPQYRGTVAGLYNTLYYLGSIIATCAVYGSNLHLTGTATFRVALWCQMLCPGMVVLGIWLCPESPRWLVGKGRDEQARAVVANLHANGELDHPLVQLQMEEMRSSVEETGLLTWNTFFDVRTLFNTRARRYRMMLNISFSWFGQFSGNNTDTSQDLPYLVANVGITNTNTQLLLNVIYAITGWIPAMIGARLHDVVGRRKMLMGVTIGMAVCLAIAAGTASDYVKSGSKAASSASIAFIYIFGSVFALAFTSMQPIYPGEVLSNDMRAKGMGVFQLTSGCAGFVNTFAAPIALRNIKYWFYVFFVIWDLFEFVFIYLFFVETKGRTLEELDEIFESKNPAKASIKKKILTKQIISHGGAEPAEVKLTEHTETS
ncbi:general substrate transporter [Myriangium duriaei CBS 260.36]|uniref:General substrate transporter n=1 Tax=Myriangium duriaei CBS 260.36 TaxID=1168546 RepID=A0A9P4J186_9PEZI|nr:general substrate transporter [Myriangium duriaei CBS 260.36]